jgi:hypothetical protein
MPEIPSPKPTDTVALVVGLMDFFKSAAIVMAMTIIEWARAKQAHAEDQAEVAKSELTSEKAKHAIEMDAQGKSSDAVVRDFLDSGSSDLPR